MTPREILIGARALIAEPENWCQDVSARSSINRAVDPDDPAACRFCALGAIIRVGGYSEARYAATTLLDDEEMEMGVTVFNDAPGTTHDDILALFDRAIEKEI